MNTKNLNEIWRAARDHALNGGQVDGCPYDDPVRKHAWVLGFKAGLEVLRGSLPR